MAPHSASTASGIRNSGRSRTRSSRGRVHPAASARNETTSTTAAAAPNSSEGIGRSALPTMPWAKTSMEAGECMNDDGPAVSGAVEMLQLLELSGSRSLAGAGRAVDRGGRRGCRRVRVRDVGDLDADRVLARLRAADAAQERVVAGLQAERVLDLDQGGVHARSRLLQVRRDLDRDLLPEDLVALDRRDLRGERLLDAGVGALLLEVE